MTVLPAADLREAVAAAGAGRDEHR